ncbi:glycoside hydrolase family 13 protein [Pseudarthrobacter sp. J75]|uniref:glycoside hydrolase family 13 protein n=1 Tax=unclassified Pseudarthrobacter TaxID=2647000 RepID=UPI002E80B360|nr:MULTISPECIES: glycoside hydrolase family 13 protein [unclassified Pseudarthrobacter]MEE2523487.1 glycoside hydrolase family 13 protein [Pseudarthrobacter sp. J47]MEE2530462.1 glycoside hydrolase family 13 protein [Pseudarthrobacter sp. J75]
MPQAVIPTPGSELAAWWADAVVYQIYPRSFSDANGDGLGDLRGVTERLDYLKRLGVDAVWLSPFYRSPQADAGYDVADYRAVDPIFGTLQDFDAMLEQAHGLGLKVIVDLVPNHTSDEHVWFQEALASPPGSPARERYIFRTGKDQEPGSGDGLLPPNNWQSIFGGPAWTRVTEPDGTPGEWYLHLFDTKQPDLNWANPEVHEEMESVLRFWLDRGVDGFRVDVAHGLVKEEGLPDWAGAAAMVEGQQAGHHESGDAPGAHTDAEEPHRAPTPDAPASPYLDQDGVHEIYREWHQVLAEYDGDRMMVAEAWVEPAERLARYIRKDEMQQAFNFDFLLAGWDAARMAVAIEDSLVSAATVGASSTWVLSNHDTVRHASRFGLKDPTTFPKGIGKEDEQPDQQLGLTRARAATLVSLALPGSAYVYQGEELGLPEHTTLPDTARQDPSFFRTLGAERGRDGCRVPLPWRSDAPGYGFSSAQQSAAPWLPQPPSFGELAADLQDGVESSTLELYRSALDLRRRYSLGSGSFSWADAHDPGNGVLAFQNRDFLVMANMGTVPVAVPDGYAVLLSSIYDVGNLASVPTDSAVYLVATGTGA